MSNKIETTLDVESGVIIIERHFRGGKLHRDPAEGPAVIHRSDKTGNVWGEEYYVAGQRHRDDGPASIFRYKDGSTECEDWYRHGLRHRDPKDGPAKIHRRPNGVITEEAYYAHGKVNRNPADGPQQVFRYDDGSVEEEVYGKTKPGRPANTGQRSTQEVPRRGLG